MQAAYKNIHSSLHSSEHKEWGRGVLTLTLGTSSKDLIKSSSSTAPAADELLAVTRKKIPKYIKSKLKIYNYNFHLILKSMKTMGL